MLTHYTIQPGNSFCDQSPLFPKRLDIVTGISFKLILNETILYDIASENSSAQKFFGISFGTDIHKHSWRLCWSMASAVNKKIILRSYVYHNGVNINMPFKAPNQKVTINGSQIVEGRVDFLHATNQIILTISAFNIYYILPYDFSGVAQTCYQAFFYCELPGHKLMTVDIEQIYSRV